MKKLIVALGALFTAAVASACIFCLLVPNVYVGNPPVVFTVPCNSTSLGLQTPILWATGNNTVTFTETQTPTQQVNISNVVAYGCDPSTATCTAPVMNVTWTHTGAVWTGVAHNFIAGRDYGITPTLHTVCTAGTTSTYNVIAR